MRYLSIIGYVLTAVLFFFAWLKPSVPRNEKLISWVRFERLCLAEFLSCHAVTLLAATAMAMEMDGGSREYAGVFWALFGLYVFMGSAAYLMHRSHGALLGFYMVLASRAFSVVALRSPDEAMMRAEVLKNLTMFPAMMLLIAGIAFSESTEDFLSGRGPSLTVETGSGFFGFLRRIRSGRVVLFVVAYYLLWAFVAWKWPLRIEE